MHRRFRAIVVVARHRPAHWPTQGLPRGLPILRSHYLEPLCATWQSGALLAVDGRRRHRLWSRGFATIAYAVAFLIEVAMPCQAMMGQLAR
jgi:hypothetical protein